MSTKLYYGLRADATLMDVYQEMVGFREKYIRKPESRIYLFKEYLKLPPDIQKRMEEQVFKSSIILIPSTNYVLAYPYFGDGVRIVLHDINKAGWFETFCSLTSFYSFGYWDNSDQPEDISNDEWAMRGECWSVIDYRPMIFQGVSFELSDETDFLEW